MVKPRTTGKRVAGGGLTVSLAGAGLSVNTVSFATDRDVIQALVIILEDRRALYMDHHREFTEHVTQSILEIREHITDALQQVDPVKSVAAEPLREMRAACRRYLDQVGRHPPIEVFYVSLGELRATFGAQLRALDKVFKLKMERQLREILPRGDRG